MVTRVPEKRTYAARLALAVFVILSEFVFLYFAAENGVAFVLSSLLVTAALLVQLKFGMRPEAPAPADLVVFVFNWLFLDLAPKIQLISEPRQLVNTSSVNPAGLLVTNLVCCTFIVTFTIVYAWLSKRWRLPDARTGIAILAKGSLSAFGISIAVIACVAIVVLAAPFIISGPVDGGTPVSLIVKNCALMLPTATLLIVLRETLAGRNKLVFSRICVLILLAALVVVTENPITEKRYALGPVYLSLILVAFESKLRSQNRRLVLLVIGMVLVFPAISLYTHNHSRVLTDVTVEDFASTIENHYLETHYDAWANIYTTVEMVRKQGPELGHQLLGTALFFVPSSMWHAKPQMTGVVIGNYLIANYAMWFANLSAPLIAEGYIDFGIMGVIAYAIVLALLVYSINRAAVRDTRWSTFPLAAYFSLYLMYALRGALMPAVAYGTGRAFAFLVAAAFLSLGGSYGYLPLPVAAGGKTNEPYPGQMPTTPN